MNDSADRWLRAMAKGIQGRADLLTAVLPRVSPEYVVVASAVHGLLHDIGDESFDVKLEAPFHDKRRGKCDLVVSPRTGGSSHYFEFKPLWPNGAGENLGGIRKDLAKLVGLENGFLVAFSYALSGVPHGCEGRVSKKSVEWAIEHVSAGLGLKPVFQHPLFDVAGNGTIGRAGVVAWSAGEHVAR